MKCVKWNDNWKFWDDKNAFALIWGVPEGAKDVTLPHDAMIEKPASARSAGGSGTGYRDGGNYTYLKTLELTAVEARRKHILRFDGVYRHAMVYVNQQLAGTEAYGYSTFYADLTPFLQEGLNEIRVQVKNAGMTNSRWYSGSGIYRDVWLLTSGTVYLEPDQVKVRTERIDADYAVILVESTIVNETSRERHLKLESYVRHPGGGEGGLEQTMFFLPAGAKKTITQRMMIKQPRLWSEDSPALCTLESRLYEGTTRIDRAETRFGIRTLSLDAAKGLCVNGQSVKLRGACIHHDSGPLGAATYRDAELRRVRLLKEAGFNAIRMAHHPAAPVLLDACDELGMFVMDEFADMWERSKCDVDYSLDFAKWWDTDVSLMVRKDFNHPSVVLYSVGNEIPEIGTDSGSMTCAKIAGLLKELDPTRYTTAGINGAFIVGDQMEQIQADIARDLQAEAKKAAVEKAMQAGKAAGQADTKDKTASQAAAADNAPSPAKADGDVNEFMTDIGQQMERVGLHDAVTKRLEMACAPLDVAGYNYMTGRYEPDTKRYPNRVMVGSETFPPEIARNWAIIKKLPSVIGDFTWTGWDYLGEAGIGVPAYHEGEGGIGAPFPCQIAYCGDLDITGYRRPLSYLRACVFEKRMRPYLAVQDPHHYGETLIKTPWMLSDTVSSWDWPGFEGKPIVVEIYGNGDEAELFLEHKSLGRKPLVGSRALFETVYVPGTIRAALFRHGICAGAMTLTTPAGKPELRLSLDTEGEELVYVTAELRSRNDALITARDKTLKVSVEGAKLLALGSGDPKPKHNFNTGIVKTYQGRAIIILKKTGPGPITVKAEASPTVSASLDIRH